MSSFLVLTLVLCPLVLGCGAYRVPVADPSALASANEGLEGREATVYLRDGTHSAVRDVELGAQETSWVSLWDSERRTVPTSKLLQVEVRQPSRGIGMVLVTGFLSVHLLVTQTASVTAALPLILPVMLAAGPATAFGFADLYEIDSAGFEVDDPGLESMEQLGAE